MRRTRSSRARSQARATEIDKQALEVFKEAEADYKANGKAYKAKTKTRPLLYSAAIRMENMINGVNDQPGGSGDRAWKGEIVNKAKAKLKAEGIDLSTADLQATMWYPEKTLWKRMGSKGPIRRQRRLFRRLPVVGDEQGTRQCRHRANHRTKGQGQPRRPRQVSRLRRRRARRRTRSRRRVTMRMASTLRPKRMTAKRTTTISTPAGRRRSTIGTKTLISMTTMKS